MKAKGITPHVGEGNDMTLAALLILGTAYAPRGDDGQVIQTAMLEFFKKSDWIAPDWSRGELVVIDPRWRSPGRTLFDETLKSAIAFYGKEPRAQADVKLLQGIVWGAHISPDNHRDPKLPTLSNLGLSRPVVVGQLDYGTDPRSIWRPGKFKVKGSKSPSSKVRTIVHLHPPGYSMNGRYAVVVANAPWSIHSADLNFFLRRKAKGWEVIHVCPMFYV